MGAGRTTYRNHPARKKAERFLLSAKLAWSDATWGPNGISRFTGRKHCHPVRPPSDDPTRQLLWDAMRPYFTARNYRDACAMVEVMLAARGQGVADMVDPDFMAFLGATEPADRAAIYKFIHRFGPMMASLANVRF
jgi:hypothetical protein